MKLYVQLFWCFFRIGALTFGGGYSMLPMVQKEAIERKGWITEEEMLDYYAVAQSLPGVIAVNTALFIGNKIKGWRGGLAAALGVVTPSLIIIMLIAAFLTNFIEEPIVQRAFFGIRVVVCALITQAIIKMWKSAVKDWFGIAVFAAALLLALFTSVPIVVLVLAAVAAGILADTIKRRRAQK